jgi:hypothetical protein
LQLRKDADNGYGVTLLRDLLLRRLVWSVRILERVEQAIVKWDMADLAGIEGAEDKLVEYMRFYDFHVRTMNRVIALLMDERAPVQPMGKKPKLEKDENYDRVTITDD